MKCLSKKIVSLALVVALVFGYIPTNMASAEEIKSDSSGKVEQKSVNDVIIKSAKVDKKEINQDSDERIKISMELEKSQDVKYVVVKYNNYWEDLQVNATLYRVGDSNLFEGYIKLNIQNQIKYSRYVDMNKISIYSNDGVKDIYRYELEYIDTVRYDALDIKVNPGQSKSTLTSLISDKNEVDQYDTVKISAKIENRNNLSKIYVKYNNVYRKEALKYNPKKDKFEGNITFEEVNNSNNGYETYEVDYVEINGEKIYRSKLSEEYGIDLKKSDVRVNKYNPKVINISIDRNQASINSKLPIQVEVDNSKKINTITVNYNNGTVETNLYNNSYNDSNIFKGEIDVNVLGDHEITSIEFYGREMWLYTRDDLINKFRLNMDATNFKGIEYKAPIKSININKNEIVQDEEIVLDVALSDNKDVNEIKAIYTCNDATEKVNLEFNSKTNSYQANIRGKVVGSYKLKELQITNKTEVISINRSSLINDYSIGAKNFDFKTRKWMPSLPTISLNKNEAYQSEDIKLEVGFEELDGINHVEVGYENKDGYGKGSGYLNYNQKENKFKGSVAFGSVGTYDIDYIKIFRTGKSGNTYSFCIDKDELKEYYNIDINKLSVKVNPYNVKINSMSIDKKNVTLGDTVKVVIDIENPMGIEEVSVYTDHYSDRYHTLYYNEKTKKFEGKILIDEEYGAIGKQTICSVVLKTKYGFSKYISEQELTNKHKINPESITYFITEWIPSVTEIKTNTNEIFENEKIDISIKLDEENVDKVEVGYGPKHLDYGYYSTYLGYDKLSNSYKGSITFNNDGKQELKYIRIYKKNSENKDAYKTLYKNELEKNYGLDLSNTDVLVNQYNLDVVLADLSSKTTYQNNPIQISMDIKNPQEVEEINIAYRSEYDSYIETKLSFNSSTSKFEGSIYAYEEGQYEVERIYVKLKNSENGYYDEVNLENFGIEVSELNFEVNKWSPTINSISIDKKEIIKGQDVNIFVSTDDFDTIEYMNIDYDISSVDSEMSIQLLYNSKTKKFEGKLNSSLISELESGEVKLLGIFVQNKQHDSVYLTRNELSEFVQVKDLDIKMNRFEPKIKSISIDKKDYKLGDIAKLSLELANKIEGMSYDNVTCIVNYDKYQGEEIILTYNKDLHKYEGNIKLESVKQLGEWEINNIELGLGNIEKISRYELKKQNINVEKAEFNVKISDDMEMDAPVLSTIVDDKTTTITGISKPNSRVYINRISSMGELNIGDGYTDNNGKFSIDVKKLSAGENLKIYSEVESQYGKYNTNPLYLMVDDVTAPNTPVITNEVTDKTTEIFGVSEYGCQVIAKVDGKIIGKTQVLFNGKFNIDIQPQTGGKVIEVIARDSFGNTSDSTRVYVIDTTQPEIKITNTIDTNSIQIIGKTEANATVVAKVGTNEIGKSMADKDGDFTISIQRLTENSKISIVAQDKSGLQSNPVEIIVKSNEKPVIEVGNIHYKVGDKFDAKSIIKVTDKEDGDITSKVVIVENSVDTSRAGSYMVVYEVEDSDKNKTTKSVIVNVRTNERPEIKAEDKSIKKGSKFNPLDNVFALDLEDGNITKEIKVSGNVNTSTIGEYKLLYTVTDSDENTTNKEIKVLVRSNEKPKLVVKNKTIKVGDKFNPLSIASATDKEDGDISNNIIVTKNTVNTSKSGKYIVVYEVSDSDGNTVEKEIEVTVLNSFTTFTIKSINNKSTSIEGKGLKGATVKAYVSGKQIGKTAKVDSKGNYKITIPKQSPGKEVVVKMSKSGYTTTQKTIKVKGVFEKFTVNTIKTTSKTISGKGLKGATVKAYVSGKQIGKTVKVDSKGNYKITIPKQKSGKKVTVKMSKTNYTTIEKSIKVKK